RGARVHLVVEVVEHARHPPRVRILAVLRRVGPHRGLDGAGVLAEAVALGELGEDRPGVLAGDHVRRCCWLRHLSIDFFENTQLPSCWSDGMRRSVASRARVVSSIARYVEASLRLRTSFGVTGAPPPPPPSSFAASRARPPACGSARRAARS